MSSSGGGSNPYGGSKYSSGGGSSMNSYNNTSGSFGGGGGQTSSGFQSHSAPAQQQPVYAYVFFIYIHSFSNSLCKNLLQLDQWEEEECSWAKNQCRLRFWKPSRTRRESGKWSRKSLFLSSNLLANLAPLCHLLFSNSPRQMSMKKRMFSPHEHDSSHIYYQF